MKLQSEYDALMRKAKSFVKKQGHDKILEYIKYHKIWGKYDNFEVYISNKLLGLIVPSDEIIKWYDKYDCNDSHVTTLFNRVMHDLKLI